MKPASDYQARANVLFGITGVIAIGALAAYFSGNEQAQQLPPSQALVNKSAPLAQPIDEVGPYRTESTLSAWRSQQKQQECPDVTQDETVKALVRDGQLGTRNVSVFGPKDPYKRREQIVNHLWSRNNPLGQGIIVTASKDGSNNMSNRSRTRAVWLVLNGVIYPLNTTAAAGFGLLYDTPPEKVRLLAGLPAEHFTTLSAFGIDEHPMFRWSGPENPLPSCP